MPQSYTGLYYHIVYSTHQRIPQITDDLAPLLYEYISGIIHHHHGLLMAVGGTVDHIHLLMTIDKQQSVAEAVRTIKANSSRWVHEAFPSRRDFAWQRGYGAFTASSSGIDRVKRYIANQHEHHRVMTFQEEFLRFLREYKVPYDERYLWE